MEPAAIVFVAAAAAAGSLHALIPDHWLPFVVMGRSRNWSVSKTLALAATGGLLHVCLSVVLGILTYYLGREGAEVAARKAGETLEALSSLGLVVFGIAYGAYSWLRERRHHPIGEAAPGAPGMPAGTHHHGHLLEGWFRGNLSGVSLVVVIGVSPCALAFPILLASAATLGVTGTLMVAMGFGMATMVTTLAVTLFGAASARRIQLPFLTHYGDLISGALISGVGLVLFLFEVSG